MVMSAVARAQGLPFDMPAGQPVMGAAAWAGSYAGVSFGAASTSGNHVITGDAASGAPPFSDSGTQLGGIGGIFLGYNVPVTPSFLVGIEADISRLAAANQLAATSPFPTSWASFDGEDSYGNASLYGRTSLSWLGTLRLRAGIPFERMFVYGTGGLAFGGVRSRTSIIIPETDQGEAESLTYMGSVSRTMFGWALGAGAEFMLSAKWTLRIEALHYDLGHLSYTMQGVDPDGSGYPTFTTTAQVRGDIARVGLAFRF
jgi:outer membrane immunogenic protein